MREWGSWLAQGRTIGWDHSWFNGYPVYQFYFPGGWFLWQVFDVVLPEVAAYRLMTVAAFPALVLVVWWLGCTWGLSLPRSGVLAACVAAGLAIGPGVETVAAGLYAHFWSVVFGLVYLGALNKSGRRWGTWTLVGFLSLTAAFLCHPYPAVFIGAASLLLLPRLGWRIFVKGPLLVAGLTAWWWLPFIAQIEMAYLDMARWPTAWDAILMSWTVRQLASDAGDMSPALLALYVAGGAGVLVSAASGAYRLARTVPDRRVLYPFIAMMALPLVNRLASTLNIGDEVAEFVGFQGGRMFFIWWIAVPALAVYAVVVVARGAIPKLRTVRPSTFAAVVSLPLVWAAALLVPVFPATDGLLKTNTAARYNIPPSAVDARTETATWYAATSFVTNGPTSFYTLSTDTGRNVRGLHRESSPTARFASAMPLPEWLHISSGQSQLYDPNVPSPTGTRTTWPVPQLQTFGADGMWEPPTTKPDNLRTPSGQASRS